MQIIKWLFSLAVVTAIGVGIVYFLPTDIKSKTLQKISGVIPESIKAETEKIIMTPPEEREKIIAQIEEGISKLKQSATEKTQEVIVKTETLLEQLKNQNEEESIAGIVKRKIVDSLFNNGATTCER
ncbi:MAG: hypothetical protein EXS49_00820 [Candidatus Pacebacteria bacterium]|nr:hypothetical protein [Candidatus Paceibacterota bacterium]